MKLAIITGISRGLGSSIAEEMLKNSFDVIGFSRHDNADLNAIAAEFKRKYSFYALDLTDPNCPEVFGAVLDQINLKNIEEIVFVQNAANSGGVGLLDGVRSEEVTRVLRINLISPIELTHEFIRRLKKSKIKSKMIFISSGAAVRPIPGSNIYCISKAGLEMLVKGIHSEIEYVGCPTSCVGFRPGLIDTEMQFEMRSYSKDKLPVVEMYKDFQKNGLLRSPKEVTRVLIKDLIEVEVESGRIYSIDELIHLS